MKTALPRLLSLAAIAALGLSACSATGGVPGIEGLSAKETPTQEPAKPSSNARGDSNNNDGGFLGSDAGSDAGSAASGAAAGAAAGAASGAASGSEDSGGSLLGTADSSATGSATGDSADSDSSGDFLGSEGSSDSSGSDSGSSGDLFGSDASSDSSGSSSSSNGTSGSSGLDPNRPFARTDRFKADEAVCKEVRPIENTAYTASTSEEMVTSYAKAGTDLAALASRATIAEIKEAIQGRSSYFAEMSEAYKNDDYDKALELAKKSIDRDGPTYKQRSLLMACAGGYNPEK